jgi:16S rRNA (guanine527-N7)-methyltransferase
MSSDDRAATAAPHEPASQPDMRGGVSPISESVRNDLERFVALLKAWQRTHNLVGRSTLKDIWTRHIADSLQLLAHAPAGFREWVDLGSGAGFPGLVVAIASKENPQRHFTLVESNQKKAAFLRAAIRDSGARAEVAAERIEAHAPRMAGRGDVVSARALAPLPELLRLAASYLNKDGVMLFLKGQDVVQELQAASQSFDFDVIRSPSATDSRGCVLAIRHPSPKVRP